MNLTDRIDSARRDFCREYPDVPFAVAMSATQWDTLQRSRLALASIRQTTKANTKIITWAGMAVLIFNNKVRASGPVVMAERTSMEMIAARLAAAAL